VDGPFAQVVMGDARGPVFEKGSGMDAIKKVYADVENKESSVEETTLISSQSDQNSIQLRQEESDEAMVSEMQKIPEVRYSDRIQEQMLSKHMTAQHDKNNKRTLKGTNLSDQNSFTILNNLGIMRLTARMGIHIDRDHFDTIDIMKDLECA
jgi:hypothetical protein